MYWTILEGKQDRIRNGSTVEVLLISSHRTQVSDAQYVKQVQ